MSVSLFRGGDQSTYGMANWRSKYLGDELDMLPKYLGDLKQQKLFGFFIWTVKQKEGRYYSPVIRQKLKSRVVLIYQEV